MNTRILPWLFMALTASTIQATVIQSNLVDPPHSQVAAQNNAIASSLLWKNLNPTGIKKNIGHPSSPLFHFSISTNTRMPSVNNEVTSQQPPSLLWSWQYEQEPYFYTGDDTVCGGTLTYLGQHHLEAQFTRYEQLNGQTKTQLNPPNPAASLFTTAELQANANKTLKTWITGNLKSVYLERKRTKNCGWINCNRYGCYYSEWYTTSEEYKTFQYSTTSNTLEHIVQNPGLAGVLVYPFSQQQSILNPKIAWLAFTNHDAYKYYALFDDKLYQTAYLATFGIDQDGQGVQRVTKTDAHQIGLRADDADGQNHVDIALQNTLDFAANKNIQAILDKFGVPGNFTKMYAFQAEVPDRQTLGPHQYTFKIYDEFSNHQEKTYELTTSAPTKMTLETNTLHAPPNQDITATVNLTDETGTPLTGYQIKFDINGAPAYGATNDQGTAEHTFSLPDEGLKTLTATFEGNDQYAGKTASLILTINNPAAPASNIFAASGMQFMMLFLVLALAMKARL